MDEEYSVLFSYSVEARDHENTRKYIMLIMEVVTLGGIGYPNSG